MANYFTFVFENTNNAPFYFDHCFYVSPIHETSNGSHYHLICYMTKFLSCESFFDNLPDNLKPYVHSVKIIGSSSLQDYIDFYKLSAFDFGRCYSLEKATGNGQSRCAICQCGHWDSSMYKVKELGDIRVCYDCAKKIGLVNS